jgi:hypothetical protein
VKLLIVGFFLFCNILDAALAAEQQGDKELLPIAEWQRLSAQSYPEAGVKPIGSERKEKQESRMMKFFGRREEPKVQQPISFFEPSCLNCNLYSQYFNALQCGLVCFCSGPAYPPHQPHPPQMLKCIHLHNQHEYNQKIFAASAHQ